MSRRVVGFLRMGRLAPRHAALLAVAFIWCSATGAHADLPQLQPFKLARASGEAVTLDSWKNHQAVLLLFLNTECPVSNSYAPLMTRLAERYRGRGVGCYGVHCDPALTAAEAQQHASEYALKLPLVLDPEQSLAHAAGVRIAPTAIVASPTGKVLYRGRLDNRYDTSGKRRDAATVHDLENALDAVLRGEQPAVAETEAFGCPLPKLKAPQPPNQ
ncbi:MAG TPA: redoxin domain-containing protein [Pirellulales bacterium]|jgi:peroxiredoxin|nr:redoxin domain-containing protein [Pirellulales bacterium]